MQVGTYMYSTYTIRQKHAEIDNSTHFNKRKLAASFTKFFTDRHVK